MSSPTRISVLSLLAGSSTGELSKREISKAHGGGEVDELLRYMRQDGLVDHRALSADEWFYKITRKGRLELAPEPVQ